MKTASLFAAGLAVAILSIAPANAEKNENNENNKKYGCSTTTWPAISPVQCSKPKASSYL